LIGVAGAAALIASGRQKLSGGDPLNVIDKGRQGDTKASSMMEGAMAIRYADMTPEQKARRKESHRRYALKYPDRIARTKAAWKAKNPDYHSEYAKQWYINNRMKSYLGVVRDRARKENVRFDLTVDDLIAPEYCPILGVKIEPYERGKNARSNNSPSIDRIVPIKGYVRGNVSVVSFRANRLKSNGSLDEFRKIVAYMEANSG
jgi:hypothetical protein